MSRNQSFRAHGFTVLMALLGLPGLGFSTAGAADAPAVQIVFPEQSAYYSGISSAEVAVGQSVDRVYCQLYYYSVGNYYYQYWNWLTGEWQGSPTWDTMTEAVFDAATGTWKHTGPFPETWEGSTDGSQRTYALYARAYVGATSVGQNVSYFYIDDEPPTIELTLIEPFPLATNEMVLAAEVSVTDNADPAPSVAIDVTSNEVVNRGKKKPHQSEPDWQVVQNGDVWEIWVRAEKTSRHETRVYTIDVVAGDVFGNTATASATVTVVPRSRGPKR